MGLQQLVACASAPAVLEDTGSRILHAVETSVVLRIRDQAGMSSVKGSCVRVQNHAIQTHHVKGLLKILDL